MRDLIKIASKGSYHAQRNWDRSKTIPQEDIDVLLEAIKNSPTKQAETHYKVSVSYTHLTLPTILLV